MRHHIPSPTTLLSFLLLLCISPASAYKRKTDIAKGLNLTGLDAAIFKLLFIFAIIFILPFLGILLYTLVKVVTGTFRFQRRLSWALYPVALASALFSVSCALNTVVLSQSKKHTLKWGFNASVAGVMANFTRKLSFTVICIALLAGVAWRVRDLIKYHSAGGTYTGASHYRSGSSESYAWQDSDAMTRFEGLSGIVVVIMMIATAVPAILNASSSPPSNSEQNIADGFEYLWLGVYVLVVASYVGTHVWMYFDGHGMFRLLYEGYKMGLATVSPILFIRGIYEIIYTVYSIKRRTHPDINMAKLGLADIIITGLTYAFLLMFVLVTALHEEDEIPIPEMARTRESASEEGMSER